MVKEGHELVRTMVKEGKKRSKKSGKKKAKDKADSKQEPVAQEAQVEEKKEEARIPVDPRVTLVGTPAPPFSLDAVVDAKFERVSLQDFHGKWVVLVFHAGCFSPTAAADVAGLSEAASELRTRAVILACSPDSQFAQLAFGERLGLTPVPLLCDTQLEVSNMYGVPADGSAFRRALFIIDDVGIVRHGAVTDIASVPTAEEIAGILFTHFDAQRPRPFSCPVCLTSFILKSALLAHIGRIHPSEMYVDRKDKKPKFLRPKTPPALAVGDDSEIIAHELRTRDDRITQLESLLEILESELRGNRLATQRSDSPLPGGFVRAADLSPVKPNMESAPRDVPLNISFDVAEYELPEAPTQSDLLAIIDRQNARIELERQRRKDLESSLDEEREQMRESFKSLLSQLDMGGYSGLSSLVSEDMRDLHVSRSRPGSAASMRSR